MCELRFYDVKDRTVRTFTKIPKHGQISMFWTTIFQFNSLNSVSFSSEKEVTSYKPAYGDILLQQRSALSTKASCVVNSKERVNRAGDCVVMG